jgi:hypothetical protein
MTEALTITAVTRRDIVDFLCREAIAWWGRLDEVEFLNRLWDVEEMPSTDSRFPSAEGDIWQHRVSNFDWDDDWVYEDDRFGLMTGPDETFVAFLSETLHPEVRPDRAASLHLAEEFNSRLRHDGWELAAVSQISGRPVYGGRRLGGLHTPTTALDLDRYPRVADAAVLRQHLQRIEDSLESDPAQAIGSSKELSESVCRVILDDYDVAVSGKEDLPDLYRKVADVLKLKAESVPKESRASESAQRTLRTLVTTIQSLAELRNLLGTGHGPSRRSAAKPRHARLAFNATVTVTEFLLDTWHTRKEAD